MKNTLASPRSAVITGIILCLPFAFLLSLLALNCQPDFGRLEPLLYIPAPDQPDIAGTLTALNTFILVIAAFVTNLKQIVVILHRGSKITTHPANLVLALITLVAIVLVLSGIIVDQYPCWIGVPNCVYLTGYRILCQAR